MILVTGGCGFVGSHLVRQLAAAGERVRAFDRAPGPVPDTVELAVGDITDRAAVAAAVRGCRHVYHLAANPQLWTRRRGQFHNINYVGTTIVLDEALRAGAERVLHCSTESILTRAAASGVIREEQSVPRREVIGPYCRSKYDAECYAFALAARGAPVVVANPTLPIGPGDRGASPPSQMVRDAALGKRPAYLDGDLNLIRVEDVAAGLARALAVGRPGRRYLLGAENWTVQRVFAFVAEVCGHAPPRFRVPYPLALAVAYGSELFADVVSGTIPAATVTGVKLTRRTMHFDASATWAELGMVPGPVAESLRRVCEEVLKSR
jgi:dihydroflavonol-4-reductase